MSSGPITLQEKMGNNRNSDRLYFLGLQNHYSDCSHGIKTCLFLGRKPMTKLDSILKNRDITLPTNVQLVKVIIFPVVMYECESWIIKKAEPWTDALELWCCRTLLRVPGTARWSSLSVRKEFTVRADAEVEAPILWLPDAKIQLIRKELTHWKRTWCEKLKAGVVGDDRGRDGWMASPTQWTWVWASSGSWWWTGKPGVLQSMGLKNQTQLSNRTMRRRFRMQVAQSWNGICHPGSKGVLLYVTQGKNCYFCSVCSEHHLLRIIFNAW